MNATVRGSVVSMRFARAAATWSRYSHRPQYPTTATGSVRVATATATTTTRPTGVTCATLSVPAKNATTEDDVPRNADGAVTPSVPNSPRASVGGSTPTTTRTNPTA